LAVRGIAPLESSFLPFTDYANSVFRLKATCLEAGHSISPRGKRPLGVRCPVCMTGVATWRLPLCGSESSRLQWEEKPEIVNFGDFSIRAIGRQGRRKKEFKASCYENG